MLMLARLRREDGNVLIIAMTMVLLMLVLGASALSTVDTQTDVTKRERQHESSFNLVEGVLNAQTFVLGRIGTGNATSQFPAECTNTTINQPLCPSPDQLARSYDAATQNDFSAAATSWRTRVRDNPNGTFYDQTAVLGAAQYDLNGDSQLWVTADATVRKRTRTIVALINVEDQPITFPSYAIAGGWFTTSNNGRKVIVNSTGSLGVGVRCNQPPPSSGCLDYDPGKGQLDPSGGYQLNYPNTTGVTADELLALEDSAKASGTYYATCPADPNGAIVVVESGDCSYNNSAPAATGSSKCCNSATKPGLIVVKCGSLSLSGNIEFHGLVYIPNVDSAGQWCSSGAVVTTQGTALIKGGVIVDGPGGISSGSSGLNIEFNSNAFDAVSTAGTAGVVQNTWREIPDDN
jgi:Tfp pilus assembly protein PilX